MANGTKWEANFLLKRVEKATIYLTGLSETHCSVLETNPILPSFDLYYFPYIRQAGGIKCVSGSLHSSYFLYLYSTVSHKEVNLLFI